MKSTESSLVGAGRRVDSPRTIGFVTVNGAPGTHSVATAAARYWAEHAENEMVFIDVAGRSTASRDACDTQDHDVLVDLGRLRPSSSGLSVAAGCDLLVVCCSTEIVDLVTLLARLPFYRAIASVEIVLVGDAPYPIELLEDMTDVEEIHVVPLARLAVGHDEHAVKERRRLWDKAVRRMTTHLVALTSHATPADLAMRDWAIAQHPSARTVDVSH